MKYILFLILLFSYSYLPAQSYSRLIPDSTINQFMNWYLTQHASKEGKRLVRPAIIRLPEKRFICPDSSAWHDVNYLGNLFVRLGKNNKYFTCADADYFVSQLQSTRRSEWKLSAKSIRYAVPENEDDPLHPGKTYYGYALPLFTADSQYVILVRDFYCGLVCGSTEYVIFEKTGTALWRELLVYNNYEN